MRRGWVDFMMIIFLGFIVTYCLLGLIRETRSRASMMQHDDLLMYSAEDAVLDQDLKEEDTENCRRVSQAVLDRFDPYTTGLDKVTIHHRLDLRRGLASHEKIWLRCMKNLDVMENVLIHELGHIVSFNYVEEGAMEEYYKINGGELSGYGSQKDEEDFAETFLMYVKYGPEFRQIILNNKSVESKYIFLRDKVFDGYEFELERPYKDQVLSKFGDIENPPFDLTVLHR